MSEDTSPDTAVIAAEPKPKAVKRPRGAATATAPAAAPAKKTAVRKPRPAKSAEKKSEPPTESKAVAPSVSAPVEHVAEKPQAVVVQPAPAPVPVPAPVAPVVVAESAPPPVEARVIVEPASAPAPAPSAAPESSALAPVAASPSSQPSVASENSTAAQLPSSEQRQPGDQQQRSGDQRDRGGDRRREGRHGRNRWRDRNRDRGNRDQQGQGDQQGDQQREPQSGDQQGAERPPERPLGPPEPADGILELSPKGYGFLRQRDRGYNATPNDAFVSPEFIRKFGLREGMQIKGESRKGHRGPQVTEITEVNNRAPESMRDLPLFEELKAINPNKRIAFETVSSRLTTRVIDLVTPVGRGQRGLIVAPPRAGKTTLLQHVAEAVTQNHPQLHLMILLVDERPEEVTEFKKLLPRAEIFASSNDMDVKSHTRICQFAIERAKRLCECGEHVFILLDSITRMARAFNNSKSGGATMSGGVGVGALEIPRRLFAAARNTRGAGSITILATALVETGSRMDDLIFQEFKGTGNMELVLDRKIAEQYTFPAVNVLKSGTRREELLIPAFQLEKIHMLRRGLGGHKPIEAIQRVISLLERYPNNNQMLVELPSKQF